MLSFVAMLQQHLSEALDEARRQNVLEAHRQKRYYDRHCGAEARRHCSLKDRQLHRKKKDQEQMEL